MVSVIIPVYNGEAHLRRCVESVTGQSHGDLEILLVNDGSTDGTADICASLAGADPRIRVITQENRGVSAARNAGLALAGGEFILFVDADDALLPHAIRNLREALEETGAGMALGKLLRSREEPFLCGGQILEGDYVYRILYRREVVEEIRFTEGRITGEDSFFLFRCALKRPKVVLVDQPVYRHYRNPQGITRSRFTEKKCGDILYFLEEKGNLLARERPDMMGLYPNLVVKTHMMLLRNFSRSFGWHRRERESIRRVRLYRAAYVGLTKEDRRWFFLVTHGLYYPWKWAKLLMRKLWK